LWPTEGEAQVVLPSGTVELITAFDGVYLPRGAAVTLRSNGGIAWLELPCGSRMTGHETTDRDVAPVVFRRAALGPRHWPANDIGGSPKTYWFFEVDQISDWFHTACIGLLPPGGATALHSHLESAEGPYETWYLTLRGSSLVRSEFEDIAFDSAPGGAFIPIGASHQLVNNSNEFLWYLTVSSRGTSPLLVDVYGTPAGAARAGYAEEYQRILGERALRGLPVP